MFASDVPLKIRNINFPIRLMILDYSNIILSAICNHLKLTNLNGRFGISPEMAIRLSKGFGGSAGSWLIQQSQYDLWQALQKESDIKVKAFA